MKSLMIRIGYEIKKVKNTFKNHEIDIKEHPKDTTKITLKTSQKIIKITQYWTQTHYQKHPWQKNIYTPQSHFLLCEPKSPICKKLWETPSNTRGFSLNGTHDFWKIFDMLCIWLLCYKGYKLKDKKNVMAIGMRFKSHKGLKVDKRGGKMRKKKKLM